MEKELIKMLEELAIKAFLSIESIKCEYENDILKFNIRTDEPNIVIGRHGETLLALQQIFRLMALNKEFEEELEEEVPHIIVDVDGYREGQIEKALKIAKDSISRLMNSTRDSIELPPMVSYKRRAVHFLTTEEYPDIVTESIGQREERRIVISKKK